MPLVAVRVKAACVSTSVLLTQSIVTQAMCVYCAQGEEQRDGQREFTLVKCIQALRVCAVCL